MTVYDSDHCLVEQRGEVLLVTINRPEARNAVTPATNAELARVFHDFEDNPDLRVAILTGAGDKAFCSGNDLKFTATASAQEMKQPREGFGGLTSVWERKKPVIAAVNGIAYGGGFEIALAADIIVASENAKFALPEPKVGLCAFAGGMHRLARQIPLKQAVAAMITGESISAVQGQQFGFINQVVAQEDLLDAAMAYAEKIVACSPVAVEVTLETVRDSVSISSLREAMKLDFKGGEKVAASPDFREGVQAFVEKRKPNWAKR